MRPFVLLTLSLGLAACGGSSAFAPATPEAAAYRAALLDLREADQAPRTRLVDLLERYDRAPPDSLYRPLAREVQAADSVNLIRLEALVDERGWPLASEVGTWAAGAAWLVVQHAPLDVQLRYEPTIADAVEAGEAEPVWLAYLTDRILVRQGLPQRYGSEQRTDPDTGQRAFYPIEDPAAVDARRAAVGLDPIREYARRIGVPYPPEQ
ncbi:DUF6624 domain-containing protein [Rubrivirga marina]|uniref:DUF6624 domain-containing protein n=1 Tax=Rubrivirga marina TaxID=1196024 RepID=UPI000BA90107|nr:DUF6624 domain-containing protein [Rubrivirga marina]